MGEPAARCHRGHRSSPFQIGAAPLRVRGTARPDRSRRRGAVRPCHLERQLDRQGRWRGRAAAPAARLLPRRRGRRALGRSSPATPEFFAVTKRLHNHLHGVRRRRSRCSTGERRMYERTLAGNAAELVALVRPSDVVILHDPQTAGLISAVKEAGAIVIWRCHVGHRSSQRARAHAPGRFLRPYVTRGRRVRVLPRPRSPGRASIPRRSS